VLVNCVQILRLRQFKVWCSREASKAVMARRRISCSKFPSHPVSSLSLIYHVGKGVESSRVGVTMCDKVCML
jgi:hypothetical protein